MGEEEAGPQLLWDLKAEKELVIHSYAVPFSECEVIDKLSHPNHTVSLLQYVAQFVALLGVYDDIFLSIHHIVTNIILRISPSDYPSRILSVALSFVRPMPIRLSNLCS